MIAALPTALLTLLSCALPTQPIPDPLHPLRHPQYYHPQYIVRTSTATTNATNTAACNHRRP